MSNLESCTTFFDNYEEREDAFRKSVDFKLARRYGGPALFWKDFRSISGHVSSDQERSRVSAITSNPRDCLAFATAEQVLTTALLSAGSQFSDGHIADIASRFGLADLLTQPVRTLSGGESVKLALAKTYVSIPSRSNVVISSPFAWLSPANRYLLDDVVEQCHSDGKQISILALDGENDLTPATSDDPTISVRQNAISFLLQMADVRIPLTLSLNPLDDTAPLALIDDASLELESPCLITGENGQGKSLVARALAGSLSLRGHASIKGDRIEGKARLLFQDVQIQTLMRSFTEISAGGRGRRGTDKSSVLSIYNEIRQEYNVSLNGTGSVERSLISKFDANFHTLLDVKAILVAVRLAASPAALILDEPDWGLSRRNSMSFVSVVITVAHNLNIPVLLISHKPWWRQMIHSCLSVSRTIFQNPVSAEDPVFTVSLRRGGTSQ